jgi:hypothetical protein
VNALLREIAGGVYYVLFASLLLWFLFRAPLPRTRSRLRVPRWVPVAVFVAVGAGVVAGMGYELFVKKAPPPCPCGVPGCPAPPACDVLHEKYMPAR